MRELQPAHVQAARSFNSRAKQFLYLTEGRATDRAVAKVIGEAPGNYSAALRGSRGGTLDRVYRWMTAWNEHGYPAMRLEIIGHSASVFWAEDEAL